MKGLLFLLLAVPALVSGEILDYECGQRAYSYSFSSTYSISSRSYYHSLCKVDFYRSDYGEIKLTITGNSLNSSKCQVNVFDRYELTSQTYGNLDYYTYFTRTVYSDNMGELYLHVKGSRCDIFGLTFTVQNVDSTCSGYRCADGQCKDSWAVDVCDGIDDCDDGSDEDGCYYWSTGAYAGTTIGSIVFIVIVSIVFSVVYRRRRGLLVRSTVVSAGATQVTHSRW